MPNAYGYARLTGPRGFYKEDPLPLEEQVRLIEQFYHRSLGPAGYGRLEIYTEREHFATSVFGLRPAARQLWERLCRHDAVVCPRLSLMFADPQDVWDQVGRLHRRRVQLYFLDALPPRVKDSGRLLLAGMDAILSVAHLSWSTSGKLHWDRVAGGSGGEHPMRAGVKPWAEARRRTAARRADEHRQAIRLLAHLRDEWGWGWLKCARYLDKIGARAPGGRPYGTSTLRQAYRVYKGKEAERGRGDHPPGAEPDRPVAPPGGGVLGLPDDPAELLPGDG